MPRRGDHRRGRRVRPTVRPNPAGCSIPVALPSAATVPVALLCACSVPVALPCAASVPVARPSPRPAPPTKGPVMRVLRRMWPRTDALCGLRGPSPAFRVCVAGVTRILGLYGRGCSQYVSVWCGSAAEPSRPPHPATNPPRHGCDVLCRHITSHNFLARHSTRMLVTHTSRRARQRGQGCGHDNSRHRSAGTTSAGTEARARTQRKGTP